MEDFDPRTWTNIPTWRANLEMRFTENPEDFAGLELDEIIDAMINQAYKAVESENPLATDLAEAFFSDVDWHNIAQLILYDLQIRSALSTLESKPNGYNLCNAHCTKCDVLRAIVQLCNSATVQPCNCATVK